MPAHKQEAHRQDYVGHVALLRDDLKAVHCIPVAHDVLHIQWPELFHLHGLHMQNVSPRYVSQEGLKY